MSSSKIIISSKMVKAMGKINDNDFIPILKAFNLQGFERQIKCKKLKCKLFFQTIWRNIKRETK
jgi:hypothetical protein